MAETDDLDLDGGAIYDAYFARFGASGDFDSWALPGAPSHELMQEALRRGRAVTLADVKRKYLAVYGEEYPEYPEGIVT